MPQELNRQQYCLTLIPSQNYASKTVMQVQSSIVANMYAEDYPAIDFTTGARL